MTDLPARMLLATTFAAQPLPPLMRSAPLLRRVTVMEAPARAVLTDWPLTNWLLLTAPDGTTWYDSTCMCVQVFVRELRTSYTMFQTTTAAPPPSLSLSPTRPNTP